MTAIHLNPVAVSSVALLRAIRAGGWSNPTELAKAAGRSPKNIARDLTILRNADLLADGDDIALSDIGDLQLDAIDRAESSEDKPGSSPDGGDTRFPWQVGDIRLLRHDQIVPDPDNARRDWTSDEARDELDALRQDIIQAGLLQNLVVRDGGDYAGDEPRFTLVGGERRWRAIGLAIDDDDWPRDRPIPCRVVDVDELGHRLAALSENLQRRNLNPLEKARAFDGLAKAYADQGVEDSKINREIADRVGVTIEHVQQHRSFLKLDEADQQRLTLAKDDPRRLSVTDARKKLSAKAAEADKWSPSDQLPDEQRVLAELMVAFRAHGTYFGGAIPVDPSILQDPVAQRLAEQNIIELPTGPRDAWNHPGHFVVSFRGWTLTDTLRTAWPQILVDDEVDRHNALHDLLDGLVQESGKGLNFLTPWLNGPFGLTPEGQVIADRHEAEAKARDEAETQRQADNASRAQRWAEARQRHLQVMAVAQQRPEAGQPDEITNIANDLDRPLPWTLLPSGIIVAANATIVHERQSYSLEHDLAIGQLIVVAANTAANQATPAMPAHDPDEVDEPEQDINGDDPDADDGEAEEGEEAERAYAAADHEDAA